MISRFAKQTSRYLSMAFHILKKDYKVSNETGHLRVYQYRAGAGLFSQLPKRALLAYIPEPVVAQLHGHRPLKFSNEGLAVEIPSLLNQMGYEVDIVSWDDQEFVPDKNYDVAILHGSKSKEFLEKLQANKTTIVYFSTGSYWAFHNQAEKKRFRDLQKRRGVELPYDRYINQSEEEVNSVADAIICLGNSIIANTYSKFKQVYNLNIGVYTDPKSATLFHAWDHARNNFLFFSGGGNVHKGLDLLLDAFSGSDKHLYIATGLDKEFADLYKKELYETPNIHYLGFVEQRSKLFYQTVRDCGFVILPSCSEGSPGSVVDCMQYGLIPVATPEAGLDLASVGFEIHDITIAAIQQLVNKLSEKSPKELEQKSALAQQTARSDYSAETFSRNFTQILAKIETTLRRVT